MGTTNIFNTFFKKILMGGGLCPSVLLRKSSQTTDVLGSDGSLIIRWSGFPSDCGMQNILTIRVSVS